MPEDPRDIRNPKNLDGQLQDRLEQLWLRDDSESHGEAAIAKYQQLDGYQSGANFVAFDGDNAIGFATGYICMGVGYLIDLIVDQGHRGQGIGTDLLERFEAACKEKGATRLALTTKHDGSACSFYEAHGWNRELVVPDWFNGSRYVQMRKDLDEVDVRVQQLDEWRQVGRTITKTFAFEDFVDSVGFVNRLTEFAERVDHHPDVDIRWNKVKVDLTTHSAGGLSDKDFALAAELDKVV